MLDDLNIRHMLENEDESIQKDETCDPDNPRVSTFQEISAAAYRIRSGILRTPCTVSMKYGTIITSEPPLMSTKCWVVVPG